MKGEDIKKAVGEIKPDAYLKQRLQSKINESVAPKRQRKALSAGIATVICACVVAVSLGVGGVTMKTTPISPTTISSTHSPTAPSDVNSIAPGFIIFAYADTNEKVEIKDMAVSMPYICKIGAKSTKNMSEKEINELTENIITKYEFKVNDETITYSCIAHSERFDKAVIYQMNCGEFEFDLNESDYDNIDEIRVKNENGDFGEMEIRAMDCFYNDDLTPKDNGINYTKSAYITSLGAGVINLSGDRFRKCMKLSKTEGNMFGIKWKLSDKAFDTLNDNPDMDLSTICDTLTFEVLFKDGSVSKSTIGISFDTDGNMTATSTDFDYIQ